MERDQWHEMGSFFHVGGPYHIEPVKGRYNVNWEEVSNYDGEIGTKYLWGLSELYKTSFSDFKTGFKI